MKKWAAWMVAAVLVLSVCGARAAVRSVSTSDTTRVVETRGTGQAELPEQFRIFTVESKVAIQQEIKRLYDFVNDAQETRPPVRFFTQEQQQLVQDRLPDSVLPDTLQVNEIISVDEINYDTQIGDVDVEFAFATPYATGKTVTILLGITHADVSREWDENTDWNTDTEWVALDAVAMENGHLLIDFPQDVLEKMTTATATTMVVFNEP